ncbi:hypothetical protein NC653_024051 [Populus alba x Populus x berolinensis]|uniref:KIB1-4 beta-propeller domain-containing protein n=1 Tax=Populus alba x Populus x berolinensis TaxID=444605 RepID=A0AAD6QD09_9ROSI|nr:hypothetical protein NC653_024051 [Populus alba x Populus x berolinensis]
MHGLKADCTIVDPNCSNPSERRHFMRFTNAIGFKGKFYALSLQGTLAVIENIDSHLRITALGKKRAIPSDSSLHFRELMVESGEEVLLVFLISKASSNIVDSVEVYQLDVDDLTWIKMESLGDRTLFWAPTAVCLCPQAKSDAREIVSIILIALVIMVGGFMTWTRRPSLRPVRMIPVLPKN